jgi:hypothetical protein
MGVGAVVEAAVGERAAEPFVEEQEGSRSGTPDVGSRSGTPDVGSRSGTQRHRRAGVSVHRRRPRLSRG